DRRHPLCTRPNKQCAWPHSSLTSAVRWPPVGQRERSFAMETVTFWVVALILSSDPNKIAYDNPQHYEKASDVVFYKSYSVEPNPHNPDDDGQRRVARGYAGFNADQVDGFDVPGAPADDLGPIERCKLADAFVQATGAKIEHGGQRAFYRHSTDHIQMPSEGL